MPPEVVDQPESLGWGTSWPSSADQRFSWASLDDPAWVLHLGVMVVELL